MIRHPSRILSAEEIGNVTLNRITGCGFIFIALTAVQRYWGKRWEEINGDEIIVSSSWLWKRIDMARNGYVRGVMWQILKGGSDIFFYEGFKTMIESYQGRIKKNRKNSCTILELLSVVLFKQACTSPLQSDWVAWETDCAADIRWKIRTE